MGLLVARWSLVMNLPRRTALAVKMTGDAKTVAVVPPTRLERLSLTRPRSLESPCA